MYSAINGQKTDVISNVTLDGSTKSFHVANETNAWNMILCLSIKVKKYILMRTVLYEKVMYLSAQP